LGAICVSVGYAISIPFFIAQTLGGAGSAFGSFCVSGAENRDVSLSLWEKDEAYRITVAADLAWLSELARVYPVKIDPNTEILKGMLY